MWCMGIVVQDVHVCRLMCIVEFTADSGIDLTDAKIRLNIDPKDNLRNRQKGNDEYRLKNQKKCKCLYRIQTFCLAPQTAQSEQ